MPYIKQANKLLLNDAINNINDIVLEHGANSGIVNFIINQITSSILTNYGSHLEYQTIQDIIGVFECAKLEFYRRVAARYEDRKINENGDISSYQLILEKIIKPGT